MNKLIVRELDQQEYKYILNRMIDFTDNRSAETADEIWILQHNSVFTQGKAGNDSFIMTPGDIPVIRADRDRHELQVYRCLLYTSPSPRDKRQSRMPSSA